MAIFNSKLLVYQRVNQPLGDGLDMIQAIKIVIRRMVYCFIPMGDSSVPAVAPRVSSEIVWCDLTRKGMTQRPSNDHDATLYMHMHVYA
jgi:hypothetical protein